MVEEKVSIKAAKDDYGVIIIKNDHSLEIDKKGTVDFRRLLEIYFYFLYISNFPLEVAEVSSIRKK